MANANSKLAAVMWKNARILLRAVVEDMGNLDPCNADILAEVVDGIAGDLYAVARMYKATALECCAAQGCDEDPEARR